MQVKSIAECSKWSSLQYFRPSLSYQFVINFFVLSIFEWPLRKTNNWFSRPITANNAGQKYCRMLHFIKLPIVIKIIVLSIFEWPFYTGFTVCIKLYLKHVWYAGTSVLWDMFGTGLHLCPSFVYTMCMWAVKLLSHISDVAGAKLNGLNWQVYTTFDPEENIQKASQPYG